MSYIEVDGVRFYKMDWLDAAPAFGMLGGLLIGFMLGFGIACFLFLYSLGL